MEVEDNDIFKTITKIVVVISIIFLIAFLFIQESHAEIFIYGSNYNYSEVVLPNNSYVHQGENISQGRYYDLSGVYGWSGVIANWESEYDYGYTVPDHHNNLNDINYKHVYIDAEKWPTGVWYQIDHVISDTDEYTSDHGNNIAFHVVPPISDAVQTVELVYSNITVETDGKIIEIPVTYTIVSTPKPTETPDIAATNITVIELPTTKATQAPEMTRDVTTTPVVVTPKSPFDPLVVLISIGALIVCRRK